MNKSRFFFQFEQLHFVNLAFIFVSTFTNNFRTFT